MSKTIIAIDDEPHNLLLLESFFDGTNYDVRSFTAGAAALAYMRAGGAADTVLLDRMMPDMDGIAFIRALKTLDGCGALPVVIQTAAASSAEIAEGIAAGAFYYLTKPFSRDVLLAVVARAVSDHAFLQGQASDVAQLKTAMGQLQHSRFSFRTLDDVRSISGFLAGLFTKPDAARLGIAELMLNAVEHGNLGITYTEKTEMIRQNVWQSEIERRLALPEHARSVGWITFERTADELVLTIEDQGAGFDWRPYVSLDPARARDSHGRGIAMAAMVSFDDVTYLAPGNRVICRKRT